jgi:hypothetical protein
LGFLAIYNPSLGTTDETLLVGGQLAGRDGLVVRSEGAVELDIVTVDSVVRVVEDRIVVLGSAADVALGRIGQVVRVAEWAILDGVRKTSDLLTTQNVVDRTVLHNKDDDILDLILEVADGRARVRSIAGRKSRGHGRKGQKTQESTRMHLEQLFEKASAIDQKLKIPEMLLHGKKKLLLTGVFSSSYTRACSEPLTLPELLALIAVQASHVD